jgi:hypothetical protein
MPRDGEMIETAGFPVGVRFDVIDGIGTLRFRVSTKDLSLPCCDMGTNIQLLDAIHDRLAKVVEENGRRLTAREVPVTVGIRGVFDAGSQSVILTRIWLPCLDKLDDCQPVEWDQFDPNRGDRILERRDLFPPPEEEYVVQPYVPTPSIEPEEAEVDEEAEEEPRESAGTTHMSGYYRPPYYPAYQPPVPPPPAVEEPPPDSEPPPADPAPVPPSRETATGRAERWGRAFRPFRSPGTSSAVKQSLNPSQIDDEDEEEPDADAGQ